MRLRTRQAGSTPAQESVQLRWRAGRRVTGTEADGVVGPLAGLGATCDGRHRSLSHRLGRPTQAEAIRTISTKTEPLARDCRMADSLRTATVDDRFARPRFYPVCSSQESPVFGQVVPYFLFYRHSPPSSLSQPPSAAKKPAVGWTCAAACPIPLHPNSKSQVSLCPSLLPRRHRLRVSRLRLHAPRGSSEASPRASWGSCVPARAAPAWKAWATCRSPWKRLPIRSARVSD